VVGFITCGQCGELVRGPAAKKQRSWRCPVCGAALPGETAIKAVAPPRPTTPPPAPIREADVRGSSDPDDDLPYRLGGAPLLRCPSCHKVLADNATLCVACGLNLQTGERAARTYERVYRSWVPGLPEGTRLKVFIIVQGAAVPIYAALAWLEGGLVSPLVAWLFLTVLSAFLLGTFDRVTVTRSERGKVRLTRKWRICFLARPERVIAWRDYEGIVTGKTRDAGFLDWLVMICLLPLGLVPGGVWWYLFIYRDVFFVALARDHRFPELTLYRGFRQEQVVDMAATLRDATELPWHTC
jgi:hypothetical protein